MSRVVIRRRRRGRLILGLTTALALTGAIAWAVAPARVRTAIHRYLLTDRILAPIEILLTTPSNPPADSPLPLYDLTIPTSSKLELETDPPDSLRQYVRAVFTHRGKSHPVKIKVRGDTAHHWAGITRSWRVRFRKDDLFDGIRRLNLIRPKHRSKLEMYLDNWLARKMGLFAPRGTFVRLRINGEDHGVYYQVEQTDEFFLLSEQKTFGEIYDSDTSDFHGERIAFLEPNSWSKMTTFTEAGRGDMSPLAQLSDLLRPETSQTIQAREIPRRIDLENFLRSSAYMTIVGSVHRDRKHNIRLYLDPTNGLFEPVLWDIGGFGHDQVYDDYEPDIPIELPYNTLQEVLLRIAPFRDQRNVLLWEVLQNVASDNVILDEIDRQMERINGDMRADRWKVHNFRANHRPLTNSQWLDNVDKLRAWVRERHQYIENFLTSTRWAWTPDENGIQFHISGAGGLDLHELHLTGTAGAEAYFDRNGNRQLDPEDRVLGRLEPVGDGSNRLQIEHRFHSGRRRVDNDRLEHFNLGYHLDSEVTTTYSLRIDSREPIRILGVRAADSITGRMLEPTPLDQLPAETVSIPWQPTPLAAPTTAEIHWRGEQTIEGLFETTPDQLLYVAPGTTIRMAPGAALLLRGPVRVEGTAENPVHFVRLDPAHPWGTIAIEGPATAGSFLRYARFVGGKQKRLGSARFLAAVCAYNTTLRFEHCDWIGCVGEDALNAKHSEANLLACRFLRNEGDGYDCDFSSGEVRNCLFYFNRDDGLDCGTATPEVIDSLFVGQGDKGISVGEASRPRIVNCLFWDNLPGSAIKDRSTPLYVACAFLANRSAGADLYRKKEIFGGSSARFLGCLFLANPTDLQTDRFSSYEARGCATTLPLPGEGNVQISATVPPGLDDIAAGRVGWIDRLPASESVAHALREALGLQPGTPIRIGLQRPLPFPLPTEVPATRPDRMAEKDR